MPANLSVAVNHCGAIFKIYTFKYGVFAVLFLIQQKRPEILIFRAF